MTVIASEVSALVDYLSLCIVELWGTEAADWEVEDRHFLGKNVRPLLPCKQYKKKESQLGEKFGSWPSSAEDAVRCAC